jgi:hypothetical protein
MDTGRNPITWLERTKHFVIIIVTFEMSTLIAVYQPSDQGTQHTASLPKGPCTVYCDRQNNPVTIVISVTDSQYFTFAVGTSLPNDVPDKCVGAINEILPGCPYLILALTPETHICIMLRKASVRPSTGGCADANPPGSTSAEAGAAATSPAGQHQGQKRWRPVQNHKQWLERLKARDKNVNSFLWCGHEGTESKSKRKVFSTLRCGSQEVISFVSGP